MLNEAPTSYQDEVYAAIDLGSNNCRLLISQVWGGRLRPITSFSSVVRLGEGLSQTENLSPEAMERTMDALVICHSKIIERRVTRYRGVATAACRRAKNAQQFLNSIYKKTNIKIEVVSPREEAWLTTLSCRQFLQQKQNYALIFDIGGGSTEMIWLRRTQDPGRPEIIDFISVPYGVVNIAEQLKSPHLSQEKFDKMQSIILPMLHEFQIKNDMQRHIRNNDVQMIGNSGTITTLTAIGFGLQKYERKKIDGSYIPCRKLQQVCRTLSMMEHREIAEIPIIGPDRADLIPAGCLMLDAILRTWPADFLRVADRGLREGIILSLVDQDMLAA